MKKLNLSIPKPCHENWDKMSSAEKGRFCSSCQKIVVDFTNMSDRQVAEFFKKSVGSVCGRLHQDQLNRDIVLPKKRIPWIKYFFTVTWPAFVLFLKSCTNDRTQGKIEVKVQAVRPPEKYTGMVGMLMPDIRPVVDTNSQKITTVVIPQNTMMGELMPEILEVKKFDSVLASPVADTISQCTYLGEVAIDRDTAYISNGIDELYPVVDNIQKDIDSASSAVPGFKLYPNPAHMGSVLTVSFAEKQFSPAAIFLLSASGQKISAMKIDEDNAVIRFPLPSFVSEGIYFLQVVTKDQHHETQRIMLVK